MANPNPEFIKDNTLQELLRDKDTGLPLSNGQIFFYEDKQPAVPKDIYKITGSAPNYSFITQANPLTLNSIGAVEDTIYYRPFTTDGTVDPYFIEVYNSEGVFQFSRQNWPDVDASDTPNDVQGEVNYIPNGQFLLHTDIEADELLNIEAGQITKPTTDVAFGGWRFERAAGTAKDFVLFSRVGGFVNFPEESPRYKINIKNTDITGAGTIKDLRLRFEDVNKFASDTQQFTIKFDGESNSGDFPVEFLVVKNYGTGGSTPDETSITTFTIESGSQPFEFPFVFGDNSSKTIGTDDDDYVELAFRFPVGTQFDGDFTNFTLVLGDVSDVQFPVTTDEDMSKDSLTWPIPKPDGSDLFLPVRLGNAGPEYDTTIIGKVYPNSYRRTTPEVGELFADGSNYVNTSKSSDGIPYSRLGNKYFDDTLKFPIHGTGLDYFIAYNDSATDVIRIANNTLGPVTNAVDGSSPTTFTIDTIHKGDTTHAEAWNYQTNEFLFSNLEGGSPAAKPKNGSASPGFTFEVIQEGTNWVDFVAPNNRATREFTLIKTEAATAPINLASKFWEYDAFNAGVAINYYVWYKVDGVGVDPAPAGRTGIEVGLLSTDTKQIVADKTLEAVNGFQLTTIKTIAAATLNNTFFEIDSTGIQFVVWYNVDSGGTEPIVAGKEFIEVKLIGTDTAADVADKTLLAINKRSYAVPDYRGKFLRGKDGGAGNDPESATRLSKFAGQQGDRVGTQQLKNFVIGIDASTGAGTTKNVHLLGIGHFAGSPTNKPSVDYHPINDYVEYVIKY